MIRSVFSRKPQAKAYAGNCDGVSGGELHGWAWDPRAPGRRLEVEQWVDGVRKARVLADRPRSDLQGAGIGDGAYGWRMPLALDPRKAGPQTIELRFPDGQALPNGVFQASHEAESAQFETAACGQCDGRDAGVVHGWAWSPAAPEVQVLVEQWVDGKLVAETVADVFRPDLESAGMGHGCYGWSMPLRLDPALAAPQTVELRIRGAGPVEGGRLALTAAALAADTPAQGAGTEPAGVVGRCDGLRGSALYGWAWDPARPDAAMEVELWVDGACVARSLADQFRPDLRSNRVGTGRYGWRLPVDLGLVEAGPRQAQVRAANGGVLTDGALELKNGLALDDPANAALRPFVEAVLNGGRQTPARGGAAKLACLAYCPAPTEAGAFWAREYDDYPTAMRAFLPALSRLGEVVVLQGLDQIAGICAAQREQGRACVLFSFGPPKRAPIEAPCPVIPVFAWAFVAIPTGCWDGDPRSDWRNVLAFTGRAVTFSRFAQEAVQAAMGADFPVATISPPVRGDEAGPPPEPPAPRRRLRLDGVVFDSRDYAYDPEKPNMPPKIWAGGDAFACGPEVELDGVLFTAFLDFDDHRKNWADLISAFVTANRDRPDATLMLRLTEPAAGWMSELYKWLAAQPAFACRVLAVRGPLDAEAYAALIAASHWFATAANAEGLSLAMQDFLAAGRPAIAPRHTAMADHVDAENALVVFADEEDWRWPTDPEDGGWSWTQHPDDVGLTTRWRVSWSGLVTAFDEAYRLTTAFPEAYARLSAAAARRTRAACSVEAAAAALEALLVREPPRPAGAGPSPLIRDLAAE